jgi:methionyl-tRNA formyltransferase
MMRIVFLTQDDPIYILPFFEEFLTSYAGKFEIAGVFSSPTMGKRSRAQMLRELPQLYGWIGFMRLLGMRVHAGLRGRMPRRRNATRFFSLPQLCQSRGIDYGRIGNPNDQGFQQSLAALLPEVVISVACPYVLKSEILKIPALACINIHHAPLPSFRGMMPSFWQMYHGAPTVGVTVHLMAAKLDEGDAVLQEAMPVTPGETLHQLIRRSKRNGAHVMARALSLLGQGAYTRIPIGGDRGSYFTFPKAEEIRDFRRRGLRAI